MWWAGGSQTGIIKKRLAEAGRGLERPGRPLQQGPRGHRADGASRAERPPEIETSAGHGPKKTSQACENLT